MNVFRFSIVALVLNIWVGCAYQLVFHETAETELKILSDTLTNMRLEDLFRQYPTLRLVKSTPIGNDKMRHEFSYVLTEKEDPTQRSGFVNAIYLYERQLTFSINIFVDASGVIYEVLEPVLIDDTVIMTNEEYDRWEKRLQTEE